ncbi:hypothetical protein FB639_004505, partial [Coemansia asiatica]
MGDFYSMLDTMQKEGLSGPPPMDGSMRLDTKALDKFVDDSDDPRWNSLFMQYFIENEDTNHDDMLFFVRQIDDLSDASNGGRGANGEEQDPVFVLRKQSPPSILPPLTEVIMWKETFLLNLIVQMP